MIRQQQTRRARGLRGKAEAAGGQLRLDLDPGQGRDQRATSQPFFQSPGGILGSARLDQKKQRRIEAAGDKAGSVRAAPFPRHLPGDAPQHEIARFVLGRLFGDYGKSDPDRKDGWVTQSLFPCPFRRCEEVFGGEPFGSLRRNGDGANQFGHCEIKALLIRKLVRIARTEDG